MQKSYKILSLCLFVLIGCATAEKSAHKTDSSRPKWIYSPSDGCVSGRDLCASAEGINFTQSDILAKKALAAVFGTKIKSRFEIDRSSLSSSEVNSLEESISNNIQEEVEVVLKTATIKDRFQEKGIYFSLAQVDKNKASKLLRAEISRLDNSLLHYFKLRNRLNIKKMTIAYNTREQLNERLIVLSNRGIKSPVELNQIKMLKFLGTGEEKIFIKVGDNFPKDLVGNLESSLLELNYKIVSEKKAEFILKLDFNEEKQYLNVGGFEKYSFLVTVSTYNRKERKIGGYVSNISSRGRTKQDARDKMKQQMLKEFEQKIEKLNLKN